MSTQESIPFLAQSAEDETLKDSLNKRQPRLQAYSLIANGILSVLCMLLAGTLLLVLNVRSSRASVQSNIGYGPIPEPYSPANAVIEYEYRAMVGNDTRFTGIPGPHWEQSMHEFLAGTLIRVSEDELKLQGSESIPLKDGGYAAGLGVAHNLHCVKKIKQFLYREHVYPDLKPNDDEFKTIQSHADHCLDFIRQGVICHLDFSMYTLVWGERGQNTAAHLYHHMPSMQKCVNWDKLHSWMLTREANSDMFVAP